MPGLNVQVEESRIWKDLSGSERHGTSSILFWRGISIFLMGGFKMFNVKDFPFDRQIINLQRLDFVWRSAKDDDDYHNTMKVCWLKVITCSMLAEWSSQPTLVTPLQITLPAEEEERGPSHCAKFRFEVRIERQHSFYVRQIYFVTYMITLASCSPLAMPPTEDHMGDRLSVYGGGLLTLVAFKYGIMDHLPSVPYSTFTDEFLLNQIFTVTFCTFESLFVFRWNAFEITVDWIENLLLLFIATVWSVYLAYVYFRKPLHRIPWDIVRENGDDDLLQEHQLPA